MSLFADSIAPPELSADKLNRLLEKARPIHPPAKLPDKGSGVSLSDMGLILPPEPPQDVLARIDRNASAIGPPELPPEGVQRLAGGSASKIPDARVGATVLK